MSQPEKDKRPAPRETWHDKMIVCEVAYANECAPHPLEKPFTQAEWEETKVLVSRRARDEMQGG